MFPDARIARFWDANRRCGIAYARHVFPRWAKVAFADVPAAEVSRETLYVHADDPPEHWPAWDLVMFYGPGVEWTNHPPPPTRWACQHSFYGKRPDGTSGLFWRNDFA